jgi:hypothetical protein
MGVCAVTWFRLARHDITDKPTTLLNLDEAGAKQLLSTLVAKLRTQQADVDKWDQYYRGIQPLAFIHPQIALEVGDRLKNLLINFPRLALNSLEERLNVEGFRMAGESTVNDDLWKIWQANDFDAASSRCHLRTLRHGRAAVSVWDNPADAKTPRMRVESAKQVVWDYEPGTSGVVRAAVKSYKDGRTDYAWLYLADQIIPYGRGGDVARKLNGAGDWQIIGDIVPNPLGVVPFVPFLNAYDDDMPDGESELTDIARIADAINKLATDMMTSAEFHAMPRRWATGVEIPKGPEGVRLEAEVRAYWERAIASKVWIAGKDVNFGQFSAADLQNFVQAITMLSTILSALAGLPPHYVGITHDNPASADAIRSAEASLVKRAERKQRTNGESWEDVMTLAIMVRDGKDAVNTQDMETVWGSAETPTVAQQADAAVKLHAEGIITDRQAQEDLGYSPVQRERMAVERAEAVAAQATAEMSARVEQALYLMKTEGVDEKIAFAAVGLIIPPKGVAPGPQAQPPPAGDPATTAADSTSATLVNS